MQRKSVLGSPLDLAPVIPSVQESSVSSWLAQTFVNMPVVCVPFKQGN